MIYLIFACIAASGGFVIYLFASSMILLAGLFFAIFCTLLFLLDQQLEEEKDLQIQRLVRSSRLSSPAPTFGFDLAQPNLSIDAFSNINWTVGNGYKMPEFYETPGMEQIPSYRKQPSLHAQHNEELTGFL